MRRHNAYILFSCQAHVSCQPIITMSQSSKYMLLYMQAERFIFSMKHIYGEIHRKIHSKCCTFHPGIPFCCFVGTVFISLTNCDCISSTAGNMWRLTENGSVVLKIFGKSPVVVSHPKIWNARTSVWTYNVTYLRCWTIKQTEIHCRRHRETNFTTSIDTVQFKRLTLSISTFIIKLCLECLKHHRWMIANYLYWPTQSQHVLQQQILSTLHSCVFWFRGTNSTI